MATWELRAICWTSNTVPMSTATSTWPTRGWRRHLNSGDIITITITRSTRAMSTAMSWDRPCPRRYCGSGVATRLTSSRPESLKHARVIHNSRAYSSENSRERLGTHEVSCTRPKTAASPSTCFALFSRSIRIPGRELVSLRALRDPVTHFVARCLIKRPVGVAGHVQSAHSNIVARAAVVHGLHLHPIHLDHQVAVRGIAGSDVFHRRGPQQPPRRLTLRPP